MQIYSLLLVREPENSDKLTMVTYAYEQFGNDSKAKKLASLLL